MSFQDSFYPELLRFEATDFELAVTSAEAQIEGARSALATLWSVNDEATAKIIDRFYEHLASGKSRAEAIRAAQVSLLEEPSFRHPNFWSAFLLISNWL